MIKFKSSYGKLITCNKDRVILEKKGPVIFKNNSVNMDNVIYIIDIVSIRLKKARPFRRGYIQIAKNKYNLGSQKLFFEEEKNEEAKAFVRRLKKKSNLELPL